MASRKKQPTELVLVCLKGVAELRESDGSRAIKPMLVGFAKAVDLHLIAKAPAFSEQDTNADIAEMLQKLPVKKWQRPLDKPRIAEMAGFFSGGPRLMPNPVLLAVNPDLPESVHLTTKGELVTVTIDLTERARRDGALWILDGQHRINGLATSSQKENPIPFVLLPDEAGSYSRAEFASIFAQVTTRAQPLEEPHRTWLEYSFDLGDYEPPRADSRRRAFEAVVWLGSDEFIPGTRVKNRFAGFIRFNPRYPDKTKAVGVEGLDGVFALPAQDFAKVVYEHYFKKPPANALSPREVAAQIGLAYEALRRVIPQPQKDAAFFKAGNLYIQEAFLIGVLTFLRIRAKPASWKDVLLRLAFDKGSWEFRGRQINTGGLAGRPSRTAAVGAFQQVFRDGALPASVTELVSYVLGDTGTAVKLVFSETSSGKTVHTTDIVTQRKIPLAGILRPGRSLRVEVSPNIGSLWINASTRAPAYWHDMTRSVRSREGFELDDLANDLANQGPTGAVTMTVWYELYGGVEGSAEIIFT